MRLPVPNIGLMFCLVSPPTRLHCVGASAHNGFLSPSQPWKRLHWEIFLPFYRLSSCIREILNSFFFGLFGSGNSCHILYFSVSAPYPKGMGLLFVVIAYWIHCI